MHHSVSKITFLIMLCYSLTYTTTGESVPTSPPPTTSVLPSSIQPTSTPVITTTTHTTTRQRLYSCLCDVTLGMCDANCCCDVDCTEDIITGVFTCSTSDNTAFSQSCVRTDAVYIFNTIGTFMDGILCVQINNNPSATHYTQPRVITDSVSFQNAIDSYGSGLTYPQSYSPLSQPVFYRLGDPICSLYSDNTTSLPSFLSLPQGVNSNTCTANTPVAFYTSFSSLCYQQFDSLQSACVADSALDSTRYTNLQIFKLPNCYNDLDYTGLTIHVDTSCIDSNNNPINCPLSLSPKYNQSDNSCYPALSSLDLTIVTNGTDGISFVAATLQITKLRMSNLPLKQSYNVVFSSVTDTMYQETISGNPGYIDTYPVIVASAVSSSDNNMTLLPQPLTILQSNPICDSSQRTTVGFRDNLASGCIYSVDIADINNNCNQLQAETRSFMLGHGYHTHIAVFGNSKLFPDASRSDLWVESISEEIATNTQSIKGCKLYTKLSIQILYASNGTFSKPDSSIRGFKYKMYYSYFDDSCIGFVCDFQDTVHVQFFLTTSVDFIDVSQAPLVKQRIAPGTTNILPNDFFYPFFISAGVVVRAQAFLLLILVVIQCIM